MELSSDSPNSQDYLKFTKSRHSSNSSYSTYLSDSEIDTIIDINSVDFEDNESWLCCYNDKSSIIDLDEWLHKDIDLNYNPLANITSHIDIQKNVDSRTFTRPKKRFARPSIERYNEEMYGSSSETITIQSNSRSFIIEENPEPANTIAENSVNFDFSQPSSSYYFEKIIADSGDIDSFQNMSPPSLVNSMCSSTFANLMESSFIKNDPILREIRDTDYSNTILLQDSEAPMFQSITESCSSISSDTPENFLKKVSFNGTFKKNTSDYNKQKNFDATFEKTIEPENGVETHITTSLDDSPVRNEENWINPNGTYRRTPKHNGTFKKSDLKRNQNIINSTYEALHRQHSNVNTTQTLIKDCNGFEDLKKDLCDPVEMHTDLNRLSYCLEDERLKLDATYNDVNRSSNSLKTSTLSGSAGSADSLDRLSSMSSSSRGSNKMLNMADVDAIVEMQERSLQQVMSTPITSTAPKRLWENNLISPIIAPEITSDSDLSSNDDYKSVRSTVSSKASLDQFVAKQPKSLDYVMGPMDTTKIKTNRKPSYIVTAPKPMPAVRPNSKINSYSNLKSVHSNLPGSYSNIYKMSNVKSQPVNTVTNLKTMGSKLKGSYTSLRPMSSNLPVAPPLMISNTTATLSRGPQNLDSTRIVEVQQMPRERINIVGDHNFLKPQPVKASGLPRPTGIPRPASRIPAPRSSNVRPKSSGSAYSNMK